jgi:hypothetical protein
MRILYTRPNTGDMSKYEDGGVSVVTAAAKSDVEMLMGPLTDEEYKAHVWERSVPANAINAVEIDDSYVLPDREFRDAWVQSESAVVHDFPKVKELQLKRLRAVRDALLVKYDGLQSRAMDLEDAVAIADVKVKKQELRDATEPLKDLVPSSIEEVKAATPDLSGY